MYSTTLKSWKTVGGPIHGSGTFGKLEKTTGYFTKNSVGSFLRKKATVPFGYGFKKWMDGFGVQRSIIPSFIVHPNKLGIGLIWIKLTSPN